MKLKINKRTSSLGASQPAQDARANRSNRFGARVMILAMALLAFSPGATSDEKVESQIEGTRTALEKWVEIRRIISQEKREWTLGREILNERIELTQSQIEGLTQDALEAEGKIGNNGEELAKLEAERDGLKQASLTLGELIEALETKTRALIVKLPEPAKERISLLVQRMPKADAETKLSISDRFLNIVGIANELNKFNREITVTSEVRELAGGITAEVAALYVGLGQGFYVSPNGEAAGVGRVVQGQWAWIQDDSAAEAIADGIAILKDGAVAEFVHLPTRVE